jgi:hypothetical protein
MVEEQPLEEMAIFVLSYFLRFVPFTENPSSSYSSLGQLFSMDNFRFAFVDLACFNLASASSWNVPSTASWCANSRLHYIYHQAGFYTLPDKIIAVCLLLFHAVWRFLRFFCMYQSRISRKFLIIYHQDLTRTKRVILRCLIFVG